MKQNAVLTQLFTIVAQLSVGNWESCRGVGINIINTDLSILHHIRTCEAGQYSKSKPKVRRMKRRCAHTWIHMSHFASQTVRCPNTVATACSSFTITTASLIPFASEAKDYEPIHHITVTIHCNLKPAPFVINTNIRFNVKRQQIEMITLLPHATKWIPFQTMPQKISHKCDQRK